MSFVEKMNHMWDYAIEEFAMHYPSLADRVVDWYPCGQFEIVVKLDNGRRMLFRWIDKSCYKVMNNEDLITLYTAEDYDEEYIDEETWRNNFAAKLNEKIRVNCMDQGLLAERTGISQVMISKYLNAKATPSFYRIEQIARALKCSVSELGNIR